MLTDKFLFVTSEQCHSAQVGLVQELRNIFLAAKYATKLGVKLISVSIKSV
jgi:hypothetical protein